MDEFIVSTRHDTTADLVRWAERLVKDGDATRYLVQEDTKRCCSDGCRNAVVVVEASPALERAIHGRGLTEEGEMDPLYRPILFGVADHHTGHTIRMALDLEACRELANHLSAIIATTAARDPFAITADDHAPRET